MYIFVVCFFLLSGTNPNKNYLVGGPVVIIWRGSPFLSNTSPKPWPGYEVVVFSQYGQILSKGFKSILVT